MRNNADHVTIRYSFIGMLFALVVANSSKKISEIIYLATDGWSTFYDSAIIHYNDMALATSLSHEMLVIFVVASSWVGWTKSLAVNQQDVVPRGVHNNSFILLVLEVILVTLYFALSASNELKISDHVKLGLDVVDSIAYSTQPESIILVLVFTVYAIWDYFSDIYARPPSDAEPLYKVILSYLFTAPLVFCFSSISCAVLVLFLYAITPDDLSVIQVIVNDFALFMVVLFFYKSKCFEGYLLTIFPIESTRTQNGSHTSLPTHLQIFSAMFVAVLYFVSVLTMILLSK